MRVSKKEIHDQAVIFDLLRRCPVGRLGTIDRDGFRDLSRKILLLKNTKKDEIIIIIH